MHKYLTPSCDLPAGVQVVFTTRGDVTDDADAYASFNLGLHVGDDPVIVAANRQRLLEDLHLPEPPRWLQQVHGTDVIRADGWTATCLADASCSKDSNQVCAVLTADCLPVVFISRNGSELAVAHAGWRGLAAGILENTLANLSSPVADLMVCLGPAIGPLAFEVGEDVLHAFGDEHNPAFVQQSENKWLANIYLLAEQRLNACGIYTIHQQDWCTFSQTDLFYSYRRTAETGRMATLAWKSA